MELVLTIRKEEMVLITDMDQHLFVERSMRCRYVFYRGCFLETDPNGQRTDEKSNAVFLDVKSPYPSAMSHYYLPCGNYQWLKNPWDPNFPDIGTVEKN